MKIHTFTLHDNATGKLYPLVCRMLPQFSETCVRKAFEKRDVKMNGLRVRRDAVVAPGAEIMVYLSDECPERSPEILFEDKRLMIVDKPAGVSCEADDKGGLTVGEWLYRVHAGRLTAPPVPCHRLDNPTDGLLILAKDEGTRALMELAFRERQVHKIYVCLVRGTPVPSQKTLSAYLIKDPGAAKVRVLDYPAGGALPIVTEYKVLAAGDVCRLEVTLHTGRTHQIRAQLAHIGHPILGDDKYGDRDWNRSLHAKRLMLSATELSFSITGEMSYLNGNRFSLPPKF
ncbi:MAG: RluA family pseudouridine synthase [Eubacteriales bacterium]|nr:RluA family pseudouridine synthase [Eubacteriales bacterium]